MRRKRGTPTAALFLGLILWAHPAQAATQAGPLAEVKAVVDQVLDILSRPDADCTDPFQEKLNDVWKVVEGSFADREMVRRTTGAHWKKLDPVQRRELTELFTKLLWRSYLGRLKMFEDQKITYVRELIDGNYAEVESRIIHRGERIPLNYKLKRLDGRWMIYDMIIDGMSLVANYRRQFNQIIRREGYPGLMGRLRKKLAEVENRDSTECEPPVLDKS